MDHSPIARRLAAIQPEDPKTISLLASLFQPITLEKGQLLSGPGLNGRSLYLLHSGILHHYRTEGDTIQTIDLILPESFLGSPASLIPPSLQDYISAISPCELYACPQFRIERLGNKQPKIYPILLAIAQQRIQDQIHLNQLLRIQPAKDRRQIMMKNFEGHAKIPKQTLASYLSLSRKHLARLATSVKAGKAPKTTQQHPRTKKAQPPENPMP